MPPGLLVADAENKNTKDLQQGCTRMEVADQQVHEASHVDTIFLRL